MSQVATDFNLHFEMDALTTQTPRMDIENIYFDHNELRNIFGFPWLLS